MHASGAAQCANTLTQAYLSCLNPKGIPKLISLTSLRLAIYRHMTVRMAGALTATPPCAVCQN
eukprot:3414909-Amphidinium_carterae.1